MILSKITHINRDQIEMIALDQLVPENHLVRKMENAIDSSFIYSLVEDLYATESKFKTLYLPYKSIFMFIWIKAYIYEKRYTKSIEGIKQSLENFIC